MGTRGVGVRQGVDLLRDLVLQVDQLHWLQRSEAKSITQLNELANYLATGMSMRLDLRIGYLHIETAPFPTEK